MQINFKAPGPRVKFVLYSLAPRFSFLFFSLSFQRLHFFFSLSFRMQCDSRKNNRFPLYAPALFLTRYLPFFFFLSAHRSFLCFEVKYTENSLKCLPKNVLKTKRSFFLRNSDSGILRLCNKRGVKLSSSFFSSVSISFFLVLRIAPTAIYLDGSI